MSVDWESVTEGLDKIAVPGGHLYSINESLCFVPANEESVLDIIAKTMRESKPSEVRLNLEVLLEATGRRVT